MRVTGLQPELESLTETKGHTPDQAIVDAMITCEYLDGMLDSEGAVRWYLIRENDRWKLDNAEYLPR